MIPRVCSPLFATSTNPELMVDGDSVHATRMQAETTKMLRRSSRPMNIAFLPRNVPVVAASRLERATQGESTVRCSSVLKGSYSIQFFNCLQTGQFCGWTTVSLSVARGNG